MTTIHHNTAKRAASYGVVLQDLGNTIEATLNGKVIASGSNARLVLDDAISEIMDQKLKGRAAPNKAPKATKAKKVVQSDDEGDEANEDMTDEGDDETAEGRKELIRSKYREAYRAHDDSCGDRLATFLSSNFKDGDGKFLGREFIAFVKENGIEAGQFADIAVKGKTLPNGFMGRARMTLRNRLAKLVTEQGFLVLGGKKAFTA